MKDLRPHRLWIGFLLLAILICVAGNPLADFIQQNLMQTQKNLASTLQQLTQKRQQLHDDADTAQQINETIKADDVEKYLALVDRSHRMAMMESQAAAAGLSHFTFKTTPFQALAKDDGTTEPNAIMQSTINLTADSAQDDEIITYLTQLPSLLTGQLRYKHLHIERIGSHDTALTALNLHMQAEIDWLSNGQAP